MQLLKYYINYKGGINNRLVCRVVNSRLQTIKTFSGKNAEQRTEKFVKMNLKALYDAYNTQKIDINPYAADAKNMPLRKLTSPNFNIVKFGFGSFSASGNIKGMKQKYYGKGALLVRHGDVI